MKLKIVNSTVKDGNMGMKFGSPDDVIHNRTVFLNKNNINNLIKITPLYKDNIFISVPSLNPSLSLSYSKICFGTNSDKQGKKKRPYTIQENLILHFFSFYIP